MYKDDLNTAVKGFVDVASPLFAQMREFAGNTALQQRYAGDIEARIASARNLALQACTASRDAYLERLHKAYTVDGSKLNMQDVAMLNPSVFKLTKQEFNALCEKHAGNHTMDAALRTYAQQMGFPFSVQTEAEKERKALDVCASAMGFIKNTERYTFPPYVEAMAGDMFHEASDLTE